MFEGRSRIGEVGWKSEYQQKAYILRISDIQQSFCLLVQISPNLSQKTFSLYIQVAELVLTRFSIPITLLLSKFPTHRELADRLQFGRSQSALAKCLAPSLPIWQLSKIQKRFTYHQKLEQVELAFYHQADSIAPEEVVAQCQRFKGKLINFRELQESLGINPIHSQMEALKERNFLQNNQTLAIMVDLIALQFNFPGAFQFRFCQMPSSSCVVLGVHVSLQISNKMKIIEQYQSQILFNPTGTSFFLTIAACWLGTWMASAYGLFLSTAFADAQVALALVPILIIPLMLIGGFFAPNQNVPDFCRCRCF